MKSIISISLIAAFLGTSALGFDTGPHYDLTRAVLAEHEFSDDAIKVVQVENWLTDYYSSSPTFPKDKRAVFEKLHFDNLYDRRQLIAYWHRFTSNLKIASEKAARDDDPIEMLTVMGVGLHATQDLYAHSNWVETHPRPVDGSFRSETMATGVVPQVLLFTGKYPADRTESAGGGPVPANAVNHGGYTDGLNHDSPIRPRWDEAYVFAYCASHEIVASVASWADAVRPGFWKRVQSYGAGADREKLDYDIRAARDISMWFKGEGQDGHWKGDQSGSVRFFSAFSSKWVGSKSSIFVRSLRDGNVAATLANRLYSPDEITDLVNFQHFAFSRVAVVVRTTSITQIHGPIIKPGKIGAPDLYARTTIGSQIFDSRVLQGTREARDPWYEVAFVDAATRSVPIKISVYDENGLNFSDDAQFDINPAIGTRVLSFIFQLSDGSLTGDLSGVFDRAGREFTSAGAKPDKDPATISGYVTRYRLK